MIRYDTRCYFSVRSKADMSQHGTNKPKSVKNRKKLKSKKTDMLRSIGKHSRESVKSVRTKKRKAAVGRICRKGRFYCMRQSAGAYGFIESGCSR